MILKANHAPVNARTKSHLASSSRYYRTREGESRDGFSRDHDRVTQADVNRKIKNTQHEHSYRLVLNPGKGRSEADLKAWTRDTMGALERSGDTLDWVAYEHRQHSKHDHVHVVALTKNKISRDEITQMRDVSNESWRFHTQAREQQLAMERTAHRPEGHSWSRS